MFGWDVYSTKWYMCGAGVGTRKSAVGYDLTVVAFQIASTTQPTKGPRSNYTMLIR